MKLAHIINPVKVDTNSDLHVAQPITFETIRTASELAKGKVGVELYTVCYPEDREIIPDFFNRLPDLERSIQDFGKFSRTKKYPLIGDVLQAVFAATDAEYLIYTNMDIALMPQFYVAVAGILKEGYDAVLVNRRGISTKYRSIADLPMMYSEFGKPHPGFDCFVFKRELLNKLILADVCIGVPFIEVSLTHNLIAFADRLKLVDDLHLTFHLGSEVMPPVDEEYYRHNRKEYEQKIYPRIKSNLDISKFPYSNLPVYKRMLKWALNPVFRTHQVAELEGKSLGRRLKHTIDGWRFGLMDKIK
ncbi:MAG TPA: hypothetical protein VK174_12640 [Chitinophagales bacterium]|nr:hypothetical protein [Chitinophagales bacterium]